MARMSRQESRAQTRERLVATARSLFLADGYNATSLEKVSAEAGFSKGAVYSNFATKHELGLAVLDAIRLERAASLAAAAIEAGSVDERIEVFARWAEQNIGDVGWTALEVEFAASTRHVDDVRGALATRRRALTASLAEVIDRQAAELGLELSVPAQDAAVQLLSLGIGLGVQRAFDPELPITALVDFLRALLARAAAV